MSGEWLALGAVAILAGAAVVRRRGSRSVDLDYLRTLAQSGSGDFEDYYPQSAKGKMRGRKKDLYFGRNVAWDGEKGRMFQVSASEAVAMEGNIWDEDKLASVVEGIENADDRVIFTAPYGTPSKIDIQTVKESIAYKDDEVGPVYTTGDETLDEYLEDPDSYLFDFEQRGGYAAVCVERARIEAELQEALANDEGDLGSWTFQIRDGNHRAFGALLAGEPYIWAMVDDNTMQDVNRGLDPDLAALLK